MELDRRRFLTSLSIAPAAALVPVTVTGCQPTEHVATAPPLVQALRVAVLEPMSEPAIQFVPLGRKS